MFKPTPSAPQATRLSMIRKSKRVRLLLIMVLSAAAITAAVTSPSAAASLRSFFNKASATPTPTKAETSKVKTASPAFAPGSMLVQTTGLVLTVPRKGHTATRLDNGNILISGGDAAGSAEIFYAATATFSAAGNMNVERAYHTATKLSDGRVLVTGGRSGGTPVSSTEIFDPSTGTFLTGLAISVARVGHTATLLSDGRVLIIGGDASGTAEIYDPVANAFTGISAQMNTARSMHSAALLQDGKVLVVGGRDAGGNEPNTAEIFDPASSSFSTPKGTMADPHVRATLRVLPDGKVQILGGVNNEDDIEIYDPAVGAFGGHAHAYPDSDLHTSLISELMNSSTRAALLSNEVTITELGSQALVAGGVDSNGNPSSAATIYDSSSASITTDVLDYPPGTTVIMSGSGWQPNETIDIVFHEDPHRAEDITRSVQADGSGNFVYDGFATDETHLGITFILGAKGRSSLRTAQTTFTDGNLSSVSITLKKANCNVNSSSFNINDNVCAQVAIVVTGGGGGADFRLQWYNPSSTLIGDVSFTNQSTGTLPDQFQQVNVAGTWTVLVCKTANAGTCSSGNRDGVTQFTVVGAGAAATNLSVASATGTYGGTVNLSATLTKTDNTPVSGKTITFKLNGTNISPTATTNASGVATLNNVSLTGINAGTYNAGVNSGVGASFAGDPGFQASNGTGNLTVNTKTLTATVTVSNKTYDGTTAATIATRTLTGVVGADDVQLTGGSATFDTKNVGTGKTVTVTGLSLSGTKAGNYTLSSTTATITADITAKSIAGSSFTANDKVYDGNTSATIATRTLGTGVIGTEVVTLTGGTATFNNKNVGTAKTVTGSGFTLGGADAGNYVLASTTLTTTANITAKNLTVNGITANSKTYDGTTAATLNTASAALVGVIGGDTVNLNTAGAVGTFADKNVGTGKTVTITGLTLSGIDAGNYSLTQPTATANVTAATITGSFTASNKVYDGTTAATITNRSIPNGVITGETVSLTGGTATFDTKNVGTGKTVTGTGFTLGGADAANYVLNPATLTTTANISAKTIVGSSVTANSKIYDGNNSATIASYTLGSGVIGSEVVTLTGGTATFADKNVGIGKVVTVTGLTLSGADAGNYVLASTTLTTTANITAKNLTVNGITANSKTYDGTAAATLNTASAALVGVIGGDTVNLNTAGATGAFADKNVGAGKIVTISGLTISGSDAGNYTLTQPTATADITAKALTANVTVQSKIYDGNTSAAITNAALSGVVGSDNVTLNGVNTAVATFDNKNVGAGKTVTITGLSIGGADAGNYTLTAPVTTTADITLRTLIVTATGVNRVYDGTTAATVTLGDDRVSGDNLTTSYAAATFADKNVGQNKPVSVSGINVTGADAGNYQLSSTTATAHADITPRTLIVTATGVNKPYDGTAAATVTLGDDRVGVDSLTIGYTSATFADKNVGLNKVVNVSGISINGGADAGNYTLGNTTTTTTASITAITISGSFTASNKVYDGNTSATIASRSLSGVIGADAVTLSSGTATFDTKNVGTGKTVSGTGFALAGVDAGNYLLASSTLTTIADITAQAITGSSFTASNKVYDGNMSATIATRTLGTGGVVSGDAVSLTGGTATFADKNVGTGKTVTGTGFTLGGIDAGNYTLVSTTLTTTANITVRTLAVTATGQNKVYDGNTTAVVTLQDDRVSGDVLSLAYTSADFANQNVGVNKVVNVLGISISGGADAGNYVLANTATGTTANITARAITVTADAKSKVYGSTDPPLTFAITSGSLLSGDSFTGALTRAAGETVVGSPYAIQQGTLTAGTNYSLTFVGANLTITKAQLTVTADNKTMTLGGTPPLFTVQYSGFLLGDVPGSLGGSLSFTVTDQANNPVTPVSSAPVGYYKIVPGGLTSGNYSITYQNGTLSVIYGICLQYDQTKSHKIGSTIPIKIQLCTASGVNVSSSSIIVQATGIFKFDNSASTILDDSGSANAPDMNFRFTGDGYIFNLSTKGGYSTGTWKMYFNAGGVIYNQLVPIPGLTTANALSFDMK